MSENYNDNIDNKDENDKDDEYEKYCYLCRRPESVAGKLIDMPGGISICPDCMQKTFDNFNNSGLGSMQFLDLSNLSNMGNLDMSQLFKNDIAEGEEKGGKA